MSVEAIFAGVSSIHGMDQLSNFVNRTENCGEKREWLYSMERRRQKREEKRHWAKEI